MNPIHHNSRGFTLIELLVVMSIIATLAGLAIVGVPYYFRQAEKTKCQSQLIDIYKLLMIYNNDHGHLPRGDGAAFVLGIWGDPLDKNPKEAQIFFCPSMKHRPPDDLSQLTPEVIDYTGPDQSSAHAGRVGLSPAMANASLTPIVCDKLPDAADVTTASDRAKLLPHAGKGIWVLYVGGDTEWIEASRFPDDLPVIGQDAPDNLERLRSLKSGIDG